MNYSRLDLIYLIVQAVVITLAEQRPTLDRNFNRKRYHGSGETLQNVYRNNTQSFFGKNDNSEEVEDSYYNDRYQTYGDEGNSDNNGNVNDIGVVRTRVRTFGGTSQELGSRRRKVGSANINLQSILNSIATAEKAKSTYTRDFGTYIGRLQPHAHGISGTVSSNNLEIMEIINQWNNSWGIFI